MTADEYLYESEETNRRRELSYGILREPPAPFFSHQVVVLKVARLWSAHVEPRHLGAVAVSPVDVVLDRERDLIVQPDVLFIAADRLSIIRGQVWGAPISSPRSCRRARSPTTAAKNSSGTASTACASAGWWMRPPRG